jgi:membrane protease YdiL (CAAX protease family)
VRRPRITWGTWDVVLAWLAGVFASVLASSFVGRRTSPLELSVLLVVQDGAIIGYLLFVARRKGLGSLAADFGLRFLSRGGIGDNVRWLLLGVGLQLAWLPFLVLLQEAHGEVVRQEAVRIASRSSGLAVPVIFLTIGVLAPVTEELLYRGALLRSLARRMAAGWAVLLSAAVFGLVHFADPSVGTLIAFPAIFSLGIISGYQALRTGDLSRSVMLHVGFNMLSVVDLLVKIT